MARSKPAVGIDLGTTSSAVAYVDPSGRPETIRSADGGLTTPSAVFFDRSGPIVGSEALETGRDEPERMLQFAKREMRTRFDTEPIADHSLPPEVPNAIVINKLRCDAIAAVGPFDAAVMTVPASFHEPCRKATQDAGRLAGLEILEVINEPTAAALCFGFQQGLFANDRSGDRAERLLVYDLGGGVFDAAVIEIEGQEYRTIATCGDTLLGGIDWDRRIVDYLAEIWMSEHGSDPRLDTVAEQNLLRKAVQAKHALSQRPSVEIPFSYDGNRIRPQLTQTKFQELTQDLLNRTMKIVDEVLDEAFFEWSDLSRLLLVGGSTRMQMIGTELARRSDVAVDQSLSPDEAVAHGAAIGAAICLQREGFEGVSITNVNSHDLGVLAKDSKTGKSRRQVMIPRNTTLPASRSVRFRTHQHGQPNVKIEIVEGGNDQGERAVSIGKSLVDDLPSDLPKGTYVDIRFDYSRDGRLTLGAQLPSLKRNVDISLQRAAGLPEERFEYWKQRIDAGLLVEPADSDAEDTEPTTSTTEKRTVTPTESERVIRKLRPASKTSVQAHSNTDSATSKPVKKLIRNPVNPTIDATRSWTSRREKLSKEEQDGG